MTTIEEIKSEVSKALAGDQTLLINRYVNSQGAVKDLVVRILPRDGYTQLVKESLDILNHDLQKFLTDLKPVEAEPIEWIEAIQEQIASFTKSLNKDESEPVKYHKNTLIYSEGLYFDMTEFQTGAETSCVLKGAYLLSSTNHSPDIPAKEPKGNKARYKQIIKNQLPISNYIAQLVLEPGKVELVKAVSMT
jgi:hypothetical protein